VGADGAGDRGRKENADTSISMAPWLTTDEINDACSPLTQKAAQRRYLRSLGLKVEP